MARKKQQNMAAAGPVQGLWDVPAGWTWKRLGEVAPATRPKILPVDFPEFKYIGMEHIEPHSGKQCGSDIFTNIKSAGVHFYKNDILYGRLRPYLNKVHLANEEGACSSEFIVLQASEMMHHKFLLYYLRDKHFVNYASRPENVTGERPRINYSTIAKYPIPLPPTLQEQQRIVARIEELFAELDKAEEALQSALLLCGYYRQAVLRDAVSGELSKEWRKARQKEWKTAILKNALVDVITGPFGSALHKQDYISGGIPVINPMHINELEITPSSTMTISPEKAHTMRRYMIQPGDIVIARRGEMGRCAPVLDKGFFCGTGSIILRVSEKFDNTFLALVISSSKSVTYLNNRCVGTTMKNLNQEILMDMKIPAPSLDEQREIVIYVRDKLSNIAVEKQYITAILAQIAALRQSILNAAFTGKL